MTPTVPRSGVSGHAGAVQVALRSERPQYHGESEIHTAAGFVREYILTRVDDSNLVRDLISMLGHPEATQML